MRFVTPIIQFFKKHYEKIILCVVLLGLAGAAIWMGAAITEVKKGFEITTEGPHHGKPTPPMDMTADRLALAQVTNPPPVILSGEHNLFNPVTWKRKANGDLLKILYTGPAALHIDGLNPLYTIIAYDHPTGNAGIYVFTVQLHSGRKSIEYPKINEKTKSGLYIVRGTKGATPEDPEQIQLDILDTHEKVWIKNGAPYQRIDGYTADLDYPPESKKLPKARLDETITLDNEPYKVVEITNDAVRVQSIKTTQVTTVRTTGSP